MATIVLDPGHGGDVDLVGSSANNAVGPAGTLEKSLTLDVALRAAAELERRGHRVLLTRERDVNVSAADRVRVAHDANAEVFVSIHFNGFHDATVQGTETLVRPVGAAAGVAGVPAESAALARAVQSSMVAALGHNDRGLKPGRWAVLSEALHAPATARCLAECSFLTNPAEETRLADGTYRDRIAAALCSAVQSYLAARGAALSQGQGFAAHAHRGRVAVGGTGWSPTRPQGRDPDGYGNVARSRALGFARGLPNLTFGPPGPDGRPLGAAAFASTPLKDQQVQITWGDFNESDTMAGSYWDEVRVVDDADTEVFRERVRVDGVAAGQSVVNSVLWTPRRTGRHTAQVRLNVGEFAIPEDRIDDNRSDVSASVGTVTFGRRARFGSGVAVREMNGPDSLAPRYRNDQNLGWVPFFGHMSPRHDFTNRFIWLVWPQRRAPGDPAAAVDVDLSMDLFTEDPQINTNAQPIDSQVRRVALSEGQRFGYEYSRLPADTDFWIRIQVVDYSTQQDAGGLLWTQAYG